MLIGTGFCRRFSLRFILRLCATLLVLSLPSPVMAGKDQFRSGVLASLSLITRYHLTIIWAIEELERKHKPRGSDRFYSEGYYYQMLVRKPSLIKKQPSRKPLTLSEIFPGPHASPGFGQYEITTQPPESLSDDMAQMPGGLISSALSSPEGSYISFVPEDMIVPGGSSDKSVKTSSFYSDREGTERQEKERQRKEALHKKQSEAGRCDLDLTFFIAMESDAMSNSRGEPCLASLDVSPGSSASPLFSSFDSPHTPHFLPHSRKRSGRTHYDGFFVGDSCRAIERKNLSQKMYFGAEYEDQVYFSHRRLAMAREDREWDFLEIKFRVYEHPPAYQFGLKQEMLCNVYHVRGRYYELCAPYTMPLDASLAALSRSRYSPLDESIEPSFFREQVSKDQDILSLLKGFEKTIYSKLQNRFVIQGQEYQFDDGTTYPKKVTCIGRGQCAVVWQPGHYNLAFRRYAGHSEQSALQQAWVQQASYAIYEQLSGAHDPEKGALKREEDIGLAPPMSLASTRVYSRFVPLRSPDGSYSLYEIQPLIPRDELVEHYLQQLIFEGSSYLIEIPLYVPKLNVNVRATKRGHATLGLIMTLIMEEILSQLENVTDNLTRYLESRGPGSLNIGIDPKIANYQVRFSDVSPKPDQQDLVAFLSNYDGYPPNLLLFSNTENPEESVLFKGGELYRLLNEYFGMYGFTEKFVGRTLQLNSLDKQVLKMLASIASEIDSKIEPSYQGQVKNRVLPFFINVVNKWMANRAARNHQSPSEPISIEKVFAYQRDSALYHRAFRLHLLAAEVGALVNPERYSLPRAEFPVSDEQSEWLEEQKQHHLLHMVAFFAVDDIDGLQLFLTRLLNERYILPRRVLEFLDTFRQLMWEHWGALQKLLQVQDFETLSEIIRDAFEAQPGEAMGVQPWGTLHAASIEQCRFSGGCVHSPREHSLHHLLLRRMYLFRSSMPFTGIAPADERRQAPELYDYRHWLRQLQIKNVALQPRSVHSTRGSLFSMLLQIPMDRLLATFRNTYNRLKRRQDARIPEQEQLLSQLQAILQQSAAEALKEAQSSRLTRSHRNTPLLASLLLDHPFVWIMPPVKASEPLQISRFRLEIDDGDRMTMRVSQNPLTVEQLEQMVLQEQATGVQHYYVLANPLKNQWSILAPERTSGPPVTLDNPEDTPDPVLEIMSAPSKKMKQDGQEPLSEKEHQRRLLYNAELKSFIENLNFQVANTPSDHFCLFHALTVVLNTLGKNVTVESLKRQLRIFIASLLVKLNLYPDDITLAEHQLIQQFGLTFLLDMLDELFLAQGGGGTHQNNEVWGDFNLILLAAVAFQVEIPFVNLNIEHWQDGTASTLQLNTAQHDGTVVQFDPYHQLPGVFIFFDEHPLQHWNLAFSPIHADTIVPLLHWLPEPEAQEEDVFAMDNMSPGTLNTNEPTGGYLSHSQFDISTILETVPSQSRHFQMASDPDQPFMTAVSVEQQWPDPHHQAVMHDISTLANPDEYLVPPHEQQFPVPLDQEPPAPPALEPGSNPTMNLFGLASMFVLGASLNSK